MGDNQLGRYDRWIAASSSLTAETVCEYFLMNFEIICKYNLSDDLLPQNFESASVNVFHPFETSETLTYNGHILTLQSMKLL